MSEWNGLLRPQRQPDLVRPRVIRPTINPLSWFRRRILRKRFNEIIAHIDRATHCRPCKIAAGHRPCYDPHCRCDCSW